MARPNTNSRGVSPGLAAELSIRLGPRHHLRVRVFRTLPAMRADVRHYLRAAGKRPPTYRWDGMTVLRPKQHEFALVWLAESRRLLAVTAHEMTHVACGWVFRTRTKRDLTRALEEHVCHLAGVLTELTAKHLRRARIRGVSP